MYLIVKVYNNKRLNIPEKKIFSFIILCPPMVFLFLANKRYHGIKIMHFSNYYGLVVLTFEQFSRRRKNHNESDSRLGNAITFCN